MFPAFFPRVLSHFIALSRCIGQGGIRLYCLGALVQAMTPFQDGFLGQFKFACELRTRLAFSHATQQQDNLGRHQLRTFENRASIERIDALAPSAAINWQTAATVSTKQARLGAAGLTCSCCRRRRAGRPSRPAAATHTSGGSTASAAWWC